MRPRGLTLIEVLAATVLLSLLIAACLPVLTESMAALDRDTPLPDTFGLARISEQFNNDPDVFGVEEFSPRDIQSLEIIVPEDFREPDLEAVQIRVVKTDAIEADHCWLVLASGGISIARWMKLPPLEEGAGQ